MKRYLINEIFYSLQGEGYFVGMPAVFIRFSGCNLNCPFCDTLHGEGRSMTIADILNEVRRYAAPHVVLTGGEPSLFVTAELVEELHRMGRFVAMETNGTHPVSDGIDWITLSPKNALVPAGPPLALHHCDELKVVYDGIRHPDATGIAAKHYFIQPCDVGDEDKNRLIIEKAVSWCKSHPVWRLSLQTHKLIGIR